MKTYCISYKDQSTSSFLKGTNVTVRSIDRAISLFNIKFPNCEIEGIKLQD
ncbi:hypothetical protein ACMGDK_11205 [Chryseobacterium sp. DT-3]|uniref:hypothetical protein n=1 Tax=Chryseobacterium sp. DT-3 TaxID=3396164 RepID=UPI003F196BFA